jgi:hypothetical protein
LIGLIKWEFEYTLFAFQDELVDRLLVRICSIQYLIFQRLLDLNCSPLRALNEANLTSATQTLNFNPTMHYWTKTSHSDEQHFAICFIICGNMSIKFKSNNCWKIKYWIEQIRSFWTNNYFKWTKCFISFIFTTERVFYNSHLYIHYKWSEFNISDPDFKFQSHNALWD